MPLFHAASKPPLGSSRTTPRPQLTGRSACALLGSGRPSSAPQGSACSSATWGPFTPATPTLERTVSASPALTQSAPQDSPRPQLSWRGKAGKAPPSPFASNIVADSRSRQAEIPALPTSCATVPERSDEADQDSSSESDSADEAQSKPQRAPVPPLRLGALDAIPPSEEDESSDSEVSSESEAGLDTERAEPASNASSALQTLQASGIELTGDADEDVRRMLALEGYASSSDYSSGSDGDR